MNQALKPMNKKDDECISLNIDKEKLKHIFYMINRESSTRIRSLNGAILVEKKDIILLTKQIIEQLEIAHVEDFTILIGVGFKKETIEKSFEDFCAYNWPEPDKTTEIILNIKFMHEEFKTKKPLKHSMFVRISKDIKKGTILQLLANYNSEDLDNLDSLMAPVFCRTDHVHDKLSKDLLNVVEEWHKGQKQPPLVSNTYNFFRKHRESLAKVVQFSYASMIIFILCYLTIMVPSFLTTIEEQAPIYVVLLLISHVLFSFCLLQGSKRAKLLYSALNNISNQDVIFSITKGDDKEFSETIQKNKNNFSKALSIFFWVNSQSICASIIAACIVEYFKP